ISKTRLCLEFSNTLEWHTSDSPHETLASYADLVSWARLAGIVTDSEGRQLLMLAERHPRKASAVLEKDILFRETVYRIFSALAAGRRPELSDLNALNNALSESLSRSRIVQTAESFVWSWADREGALDYMLWPVIRSAGELLTFGELERVRECAGAGCGWLFIDLGRNKVRRWSDMKSCGNRAKARRHYERIKAAR